MMSSEFMSRKGGRRFANIQDSVDALIQLLEDYIRKCGRKTDYSDQKRHRKHKHQQNKNKQKTKMGRKTTQWTFQVTNKRNLPRENLDMA